MFYVCEFLEGVVFLTNQTRPGLAWAARSRASPPPRPRVEATLSRPRLLRSSRPQVRITSMNNVI